MALDTFTVALDSCVPPGPVAVKLYVVVVLGLTSCWPEAATFPKPRISALSAPADDQVSRVESPQPICVCEAENCELRGPTATVALAMPALKRGSAPSFAPRGQSVVRCSPEPTFTITRWLAGTLTEPVHTVRSPCISVTSCVPGGTRSSCFQPASWLKSSASPT